MSALKIGELFAGYGGLGMGVASVLGGDMAWCAEFDKAPSKILAHHWPDVPNLGDVTKVDWSSVEPVDVITGGSPCQDLSHAGKRLGMKAGTRSGLWASMCDAIDIIRPRLVVWENVRGALSAEADSALEPCAGCVGDGDDGPVLRALGRVLGDLADLGYDAAWYGLRAADVGAAHGRFRIFVFATPGDATGDDLWHDGIAGSRGPRRALVEAGGADSDVVHVPGQLTLLPTPVSDNSRGLPSASTDYASLANVACALLPTPTSSDYKGSTTTRRQPGQDRGQLDAVTEGGHRWGDYAPAIARWEHTIGRPAPAPTEPSKNGAPRLSPVFVEFLMGLPAGHVTDPTIGISRNDQLKALGNGVVPQQAAAATRAFLADLARIGAAA